MNKFIIFIVVYLTAQCVFAQTQNILKITVKNDETKENVAEANVSVKGAEISGLTDANGKTELKTRPLILNANFRAARSSPPNKASPFTTAKSKRRIIFSKVGY